MPIPHSKSLGSRRVCTPRKAKLSRSGTYAPSAACGWSRSVNLGESVGYRGVGLRGGASHGGCSSAGQPIGQIEVIAGRELKARGSAARSGALRRAVYELTHVQAFSSAPGAGDEAVSCRRTAPVSAALLPQRRRRDRRAVSRMSMTGVIDANGSAGRRFALRRGRHATPRREPV